MTNDIIKQFPVEYRFAKLSLFIKKVDNRLFNQPSGFVWLWSTKKKRMNNPNWINLDPIRNRKWSGKKNSVLFIIWSSSLLYRISKFRYSISAPLLDLKVLFNQSVKVFKLNVKNYIISYWWFLWGRRHRSVVENILLSLSVKFLHPSSLKIPGK